MGGRPYYQTSSWRNGEKPQDPSANVASLQAKNRTWRLPNTWYHSIVTLAPWLIERPLFQNYTRIWLLVLEHQMWRARVLETPFDLLLWFIYDFTSRHYTLFLQCALILWRCVSERSWFLCSGPLISFHLVFSDLCLSESYVTTDGQSASLSSYRVYLPKSTLLSTSSPDWYENTSSKGCLWSFCVRCRAYGNVLW
jgi:hypothetical protein